MKLLLSLCLAAFKGIRTSAQTLYLAGDSTMALGGGGDGTQGWGVYLPNYLDMPIVNNAVAGTSARSYSDLGYFATLIDQAKAGDYAVIEFGHNDVASEAGVDNGTQDAVGEGYNVTELVTATNGSTILIHSFAYYIENAVSALEAKGVTPIISSLTPDNIWTTTAPIQIAAGGRFVTYAQGVSQDTGIVFIDHFDYVAQAYDALGETKVDTFYSSNEHLHTLPAGATVVAEAFVRGLLCSSSPLKRFVNSAGQAVPNGCL
uniref:Rhamnogalacturonan acetylesterase n=1 Tax=Mycena chlorophos TaxID=658473 RepID=A0ABQ0MA73_MYCCL|nr:rhamnogalacturonan acetylesterase [Mycena chlorophos]